MTRVPFCLRPLASVTGPAPAPAGTPRRSRLAGRTRGEERDCGASQRARCKEIQAGLETAGRILDPADNKGADITAKVADGIDHRDRACRGCTGEEDRGHRPERRAGAVDADGSRRHSEQRPVGGPGQAGEHQAGGAERRRDDEMPAPLAFAIRRPAPGDQADGADDVGHRGHHPGHRVRQANAFDDLRHEEDDAVIGRHAHEVHHRQG